MSPFFLALGIATLCAAAAGFQFALATAREADRAEEPGRSARLGILLYSSAGLLSAGTGLILQGVR